jgi:hypothetical protein
MTKNQIPEPEDESTTPAPAPGAAPDQPSAAADVEGHVASLREGGRPDARVHVRETDPWTSRGSSGRRRPHKP